MGTTRVAFICRDLRHLVCPVFPCLRGEFHSNCTITRYLRPKAQIPEKSFIREASLGVEFATKREMSAVIGGAAAVLLYGLSRAFFSRTLEFL